MFKKLFKILFFGLTFFTNTSFSLCEPNSTFLLNKTNNLVINDNITNYNISNCAVIECNDYNCVLYHDYLLLGTTYSIIFFFLITSAGLSKFTDTTWFNRYLIVNNTFQLTTGLITFFSIYFCWWIGMLIYSFMTNDPGEVLFRLGVLITLNIAMILLPITRNSIWISLFSISHYRIKYIHMFIAILSLISIIIKIIIVCLQYNFNYLFIPYDDDIEGSPLAGTIASLSIIFTSILALPIIRKRFFELFYISHKFLLLVTIVAASTHYILVLYYIIPSLLLYIIDIFCRFLNIKSAVYSHLKIIGDKTPYILITISLNKTVKVLPGSYYFICFQDITPLEWHPLSVITREYDNLTFCAKDMGENSWTNKLKLFESKKLKNNNILIQGPYGHLSIDYKNNRYKYAILIAGGIGITPILSIIEDINTNISKYKHLKKIYLIWIVNNMSLVKEFNYIFTLIDKNIFYIDIYCTNKDEINENFVVKYTKPDITSLISEIYNKNGAIKKEFCAICCGPENLSIDVMKICTEFNIDICNENF